jgi:hypothetical protein
MKTNSYLKVKRDGKWVTVLVEDMTDKERIKTLGKDPSLINWLNLLCHTLKGKEY